MDHTGTVDPDAQCLEILEFCVKQIGLSIVPIGAARRLGIGHHEGQFEHFGLRKAARRVACHGPDDIGHAVNHLVDQLGRGAAQLHRGETVDLDPPVAVCLDLVGPDIQNQFRHIGLRGQELVQLQRHFLRMGRDGHAGHHGGGRNGAQCRFHKGHSLILPKDNVETAPISPQGSGLQMPEISPAPQGSKSGWRAGCASANAGSASHRA